MKNLFFCLERKDKNGICVSNVQMKKYNIENWYLYWRPFSCIEYVRFQLSSYENSFWRGPRGIRKNIQAQSQISRKRSALLCHKLERSIKNFKHPRWLISLILYKS